MAPQVLLKNGNVRERQRVRIDETHFLQKKQNKTILELLREQGKYLDAPCSGKGTCGKCCIIIEETRKTDPPKQREKEVFTERELEEGWRLSCMTVPTDDLYVCIPEIRENQIQVQMEFVRNTKMESDVQATTVICENKIEDRAQIGSDGEIKPENMDTEKSVYGIAIDIGTTTLAAELISLTDGICLKTASSVNHQRAYGADVISRIRAAASGDAEKLRESILKDVRNLAETLLAGQDENVLNVSKIVIAGNTTMIHLLLGYSCVGLGAAPFTPVNLAPEDMTWGELNGEYEETRESGDAKESGVAREHGYVRECGHTGINQTTKVQIMPGISAFVGGDITAGMMGCGMRPDKCEMLIDIGTNGEMVLAAGDHFLVSSVAAGPAFEGGNISCGMPGVPGAVCRAVLFGKNNMVTKTIGNKPAIGLCGTGIIDVMYELVRHHIVDTQGILGEPWFEKDFRSYPEKFILPRRISDRCRWQKQLSVRV